MVWLRLCVGIIRDFLSITSFIHGYYIKKFTQNKFQANAFFKKKSRE